VNNKLGPQSPKYTDKRRTSRDGQLYRNGKRSGTILCIPVVDNYVDGFAIVKGIGLLERPRGGVGQISTVMPKSRRQTVNKCRTPHRLAPECASAIPAARPCPTAHPLRRVRLSAATP